MYDFFKDISLESEEKLPEKRIDSIKAAVLSRIKEENSMKKISAFKTFSIAAIVAATAAMSAMLASAEKPASLPTKQPDVEQPAAVIEQSTPATAETPKDADEKDSNKENVANTENKSNTQTYTGNGKWMDMELPNGTKFGFLVHDGEVPMKFDSVQAASDYAISQDMPYYGGVATRGAYDDSDSLVILFVDE